MKKKTTIETAIEQIREDAKYKHSIYQAACEEHIKILTNLIIPNRDEIKEGYKAGYLHCRQGLDLNSGAYMNETYPS